MNTTNLFECFETETTDTAVRARVFAAQKAGAPVLDVPTLDEYDSKVIAAQIAGEQKEVRTEILTNYNKNILGAFALDKSIVDEK
jgi:hypothetical protein